MLTKTPKPTHNSRKSTQIFLIFIYPFFNSDLLSSNYVEIHYEDGKPKFSKVLCSCLSEGMMPIKCLKKREKMFCMT